MPISPNEIPLDPRDLLQRVANADQNLYARVVAEAQRDELVKLVNDQEQQAQQPQGVPTPEEPSGPLTDAAKKRKDAEPEDDA